MVLCLDFLILFQIVRIIVIKHILVIERVIIRILAEHRHRTVIERIQIVIVCIFERICIRVRRHITALQLTHVHSKLRIRPLHIHDDFHAAIGFRERIQRNDRV